MRNDGIARKVTAQIKALNTKGMSCRQMMCERKEPLTLWRKIAIHLPFGHNVGDPLNEYKKEFDGYDFFYIRRKPLTLLRLLNIRKLRKHNPDAKILYEICTYPFKKELTHNKRNIPLWLREVCYMPFMKRYIDRIVIVSEDKSIAGIPTIPIINGIDLKLIRPINPAPEDGAIHIIAIAKIQWWHGYDRFLRGMAYYYRSGGTRHLKLHIVGNGPAEKDLRIMIARYGLEDRVIMHGYKTGEDLDTIYDRCHLGLIALATQDKDLHVHSTLKSRDYLAKGLPTMSTGMTDVFIGTDYKYNLKLPNDKEKVDMRNIISFYDEIYGNTPRRQVIKEIRDFAERTIDINITMEPVVRYLMDEG